MPSLRCSGLRSRKSSARERSSFSASHATARLSARRSLAGGLLVDVLAGHDAAAPAQIGDLAAAGLGGAADQRLHQCGRLGLAGQQGIESVVGVHQLDLVERHAGGLHDLDRSVEGAGMPGHGDRHVAQFRQRLDTANRCAP